MLINFFTCCLIIMLTLSVSPLWGASSHDAVYKKYPRGKYLVGIGEAQKSANSLTDKRIAEVLARLEIAKQIKVRLREETVDIMCEGGSQRLFRDILQCKNEFIMIVEVSVDEFLEGSKIVEHGQSKETVYAVAVMPRAQAVEELNGKVSNSLNTTREKIGKAKEGDKKAAAEAQEEYMKAVTNDKERELLDGVKDRASAMFDELEKELLKLHEKN